MDLQHIHISIINESQNDRSSMKQQNNPKAISISSNPDLINAGTQFVCKLSQKHHSSCHYAQ